MTELLHGLDPILGQGPRVLILGNMPSVMSLASGQYYGNPRNAFWRIAGSLFGFSADAPYPDRVAALCAHQVAVWDVLWSCRRAGSLDSAVERDSMVPNDFAAFFTAHRTLQRLVFNGAAAEANYRRLVGTPPLPSVRAPSTSPAQTMGYEDKLVAWRAVLDG
ncbi:MULTISPECIES: DNA-deoxyinosine glycosylase [unclassified Mycolicibacterium]|uniref:DNA-deoxyinosine glycosylase n=1 Tax=unclassified Mycolicibacterium TaxID=2636767 RepID=UPI0012DF5B66|nr:MULTISPECIES: DNA-deoxyinosine glycosylase [unclassified Mycolicibacterium]MUL84903.1 DNA-deoxyinosine glycosylase [Mycolicibacterium sp. CBMA 329]MUL90870.1 DNA-deoxyinosine glycosylase [Mycolicibacterium sp. CBMA 331]MUM01818.1 DNA-deoxyinosine glycosylase [Mycolicibacterium sp. CBMA 334]MUM29262.1 DNA-deoxyinosine glycosylase [Mycolicibacterium sp. CBMA 295]MUM40629.1 DNA-deoxyinosine glycosylase [Mycolicibacterium sp. CBMA 247]